MHVDWVSSSLCRDQGLEYAAFWLTLNSWGLILSRCLAKSAIDRSATSTRK